jgi:hypothetical protein
MITTYGIIDGSRAAISAGTSAKVIAIATIGVADSSVAAGRELESISRAAHGQPRTSVFRSGWRWRTICAGVAGKGMTSV